MCVGLAWWCLNGGGRKVWQADRIMVAVEGLVRLHGVWHKLAGFSGAMFSNLHWIVHGNVNSQERTGMTPIID